MRAKQFRDKEPTMSSTVNPEIAELRHQVTADTKEIAELRGNIQQLNQFACTASRQSTLQIAAIVISLCLTIAGGLYFQTNALDRRIENSIKGWRASRAISMN
jgi:hypothetical protein